MLLLIYKMPDKTTKRNIYSKVDSYIFSLHTTIINQDGSCPYIYITCIKNTKDIITLGTLLRTDVFHLNHTCVTSFYKGVFCSHLE